MNVEFSQQANLSIEGYRNALVEQYGRSEDRANELKQQMEDTIRTRASNADSFPICQDVKLGQQKDGAGNALNKNLRHFKYESPKSHSAWGVSVLCDFENDLAIVYRIVHSSYLTEPPPGWKQQSNDSQQEKVKESNAKWLLLSKFVNRNTMRNNTMKKLNITKEQFNRSRYFQKKYGTLEYVSESGKVYKTSKGKLLKFNESDIGRRSLEMRYLNLIDGLYGDAEKYDPYGEICDKTINMIKDALQNYFDATRS